VNVSNLKADIDFLCGSSSGTYPDADKIRNMNVAYQQVATDIWRAADGWQYDDSNATSLPKALATLVHNQQDYTLPSTAQFIQRLEIKDAYGNFQKIRPIDMFDVHNALPEFQETPGLPLYYDLVGRSLMLYPAPSSAYCTLASGMAVYVERDVSEFAVTATTQVPGFASSFHRILSYAAAIDFVQDKTEKDRLIGLKAQLENSLKNLYSRRNVERQSRISPRGAGNGSRQYQ
jgi:hypothetical protein